MVPSALPNFMWRAVPAPFPMLSFQNSAGENVDLTAFSGRFVLLNFWATWCGPCKLEMPSLDRLQQRYPSNRLSVIALSSDRTGPAAVLPFFEEVGIQVLEPYYDPWGSNARGVISQYPTTVLLGPDGRELGRIEAPAEWDSPAALDVIEKALKGAAPQ